MKKIFILIIFLLTSLMLCYKGFDNICVHASDDNYQIYTIYDDNFNVLCEKDFVEVGDCYISHDKKYYEIVYVDNERLYGIAKFIRVVELPNVNFSHTPKPINITRRVICLYMSHNDESYLPSDGVDSVYGNGGIRDVALAFEKALNERFITTYFDDTLHIPHDNEAYNRSRVTAKKLYDNYSPDAIFDIHRDATSRQYYVANVNGKERGRVRIVLGKANPNLAINEEFALYIMAVANELYPWLVTDIYYGGGHYNQSLDGKALLFEMGTYLIEKELMMESMNELADVVTTALYNTTVNENSGDLTINGVEDEDNVVVNDVINEKQDDNEINVMIVSIVIVIMASVSIYSVAMFVYNIKKMFKK